MIHVSLLSSLNKTVSLSLSFFISYRYTINHFSTFPKRQILNSSKLKEYDDNNFELDENDRKSSQKWWKALWEKEKLLVTSNFSFSHSVFKRLVLQKVKNKGLFGKELN